RVGGRRLTLGALMTAVTKSATDVAAESPVVDDTTGAHFVTASLQNGKRTVLQFFRTPQLLMLGTIQGALFLFMFRYIFGGAINPGGGIEYVDFLVPGFLATGILWLGMPAATGVAEDATTGYWVGLSFVWWAGILLVFGTIAVSRFARRR